MKRSKVQPKRKVIIWKISFLTTPSLKKIKRGSMERNNNFGLVGLNFCKLKIRNSNIQDEMANGVVNIWYVSIDIAEYPEETSSELRTYEVSWGNEPPIEYQMNITNIV